MDETETMGNLLLFVILVPSLNNGFEIPYMSNVYGNQTWDEAANDSTCSMIGLNLTGEAEDIDNVTGNIVWDTHRTAWIGAYARRVWINFEGCQFGILKSNYSWMTLKPQADPAKSCLSYCNYSRFVLAEDKCVCDRNVPAFNTGCKAKPCINTKYRYCGKGTAVTSNITYHCMCRFSMEKDPNSITNEGNCLSVEYRPQRQRIVTNCSDTYIPICYDRKNNQVDLSGRLCNWSQSILECYDKNLQFASKTTAVTGIPHGTYWVGTFAVTYKFWGRPRTDNDRCVAVSKDRTNYHLTTVVLPCDTLLPALCSNTSLTTQSTTETTVYTATTESVSSTVSLESTTRINDTSGSHLQTTSIGFEVTSLSSESTKINSLPSSSLPTSAAQKESITSQFETATTVGLVVAGLLILIIFSVVLLLRHRGVFRKTQTSRRNINGVMSEIRNPGGGASGQTDGSINDDVYNHLGELTKRKNMSDDDLYDHTGAEGDTYGYLSNDRYEEDNEYDHTFNHTTGDTYGHLNNSYRHDNDSEYDHTGGDIYGRLNGHNHQSDDDSNYDHTGDMYSHLNASRYRDVVDDIYDHTGESGNVYGHLNMSKPEVENEYEHTRVTHDRLQPEVDSEYDHTRVTNGRLQPEVDSEYDHTRLTNGRLQPEVEREYNYAHVQRGQKGQNVFSVSEATDNDNITSVA